MKYKDALRNAMIMLSNDARVIFIGYNVKYGSRAYGTLKDISLEKCIEMPVAENLMTGIAMGLSLEGYRPVLFYERNDFLLNGMDAIVNHLDKIKPLSHDEFRMPVIIRAVVGGTKPIYPGLQHIQDYSKALKEMVSFPVIELHHAGEIVNLYKKALESEEPHLFIERKDLYETE